MEAIATRSISAADESEETRHPNNLTTDDEIDAAILRAETGTCDPDIVEAVYHPGPVHAYLMLRLSDGKRLLIPREMLTELNHATDEQASQIIIPPSANMIYWPQLDDGLYLPEFLEHRWHSLVEPVAA